VTRCIRDLHQRDVESLGRRGQRHAVDGLGDLETVLVMLVRGGMREGARTPRHCVAVLYVPVLGS
jgi:hypothetical protein